MSTCKQYVYAIEGAGLVKIGRAVAPEYRRVTLQSGSPVNLKLRGFVVGDHRLERELHDRFAAYRRHGEWFSLIGIVAEWVDGLTVEEQAEAAA
ncbi:GIY-YIG nuclease family protein [Rhizobium leguminosarum]